MKKLILAVLFGMLLMPSAGFARDWGQRSDEGRTFGQRGFDRDFGRDRDHEWFEHEWYEHRPEGWYEHRPEGWFGHEWREHHPEHEWFERHDRW